MSLMLYPRSQKYFPFGVSLNVSASFWSCTARGLDFSLAKPASSNTGASSSDKKLPKRTATA
eukprot:1418347-Pyramimonas_sp.AAC.1